ncbi:MAG: hypothetical protein FJ312_09820 [SAR202 cluster bacterium]|nr:hypothetical protein [SAR202 cluster bacterium]
MGTFRVQIAVGDPSGREYAPAEALVDTGATYTTLPASLLKRLGVAPHEQAEFEIADGRRIQRGVGYTWLRIDGRTAVVPVIFAEEGAPALLGAVTLEIFRLGVDPVKKRLVPVPALLMAYVGVGRQRRHE